MTGILNHIARVERVALAALMLLMSAAYVFNIAVREIAPMLAPRLAWIEEATLFALAWLVFLGLGLALERGRHIAMRVLLGRMAAPARRVVALAMNLTGLGFSLYVCKAGLDLALFVLGSGQVSPTLDISMAWLYGALPAGFLLMALRFAAELAGAGDRLSAEDSEAAQIGGAP